MNDGVEMGCGRFQVSWLLPPRFTAMVTTNKELQNHNLEHVQFWETGFVFSSVLIQFVHQFAFCTVLVDEMLTLG